MLSVVRLRPPRSSSHQTRSYPGVTPSVFTSPPQSSNHQTGSDQSVMPPVKRYHQHQYEPDQLDWYIKQFSQNFVAANSWGDFIQDVQGWGDLHPDVGWILHPAAHLLD